MASTQGVPTWCWGKVIMMLGRNHIAVTKDLRTFPPPETKKKRPRVVPVEGLSMKQTSLWEIVSTKIYLLSSLNHGMKRDESRVFVVLFVVAKTHLLNSFLKIQNYATDWLGQVSTIRIFPFKRWRIWTDSHNIPKKVKCWGNLDWRKIFCFNKRPLCLGWKAHHWKRKIHLQSCVGWWGYVSSQEGNLHFNPFPCDFFRWSLRPSGNKIRGVTHRLKQQKRVQAWKWVCTKTGNIFDLRKLIMSFCHFLRTWKPKNKKIQLRKPC